MRLGASRDIRCERPCRAQPAAPPARGRTRPYWSRTREAVPMMVSYEVNHRAISSSHSRRTSAVPAVASCSEPYREAVIQRGGPPGSAGAAFITSRPKYEMPLPVIASAILRSNAALVPTARASSSIAADRNVATEYRTDIPSWYSPKRVSSSTPLPRPNRSVSPVGSSSPSAMAPARHEWNCPPPVRAWSLYHARKAVAALSSSKKVELKTRPSSDS
mmetsp:Transcript_49158/g.162747  ORF Transcript_49158/g.162747 Transcript_49158/m.162747 type:complete len:218 (-) Transcript_49158:215-868(-)